MDALPIDSSDAEREVHYTLVAAELRSLLEGDFDWISAMATVASELHGAFAYYDWTGFYRLVAPTRLVVGPYQGGHGCLEIETSRGVCGAAARERATQLVDDVEAFPGHIACSSSTRSELVVPLIAAPTDAHPSGRVLGVLDVDSDVLDDFDEVDVRYLEEVVELVAQLAGF